MSAPDRLLPIVLDCSVAFGVVATDAPERTHFILASPQSLFQLAAGEIERHGQVQHLNKSSCGYVRHDHWIWNVRQASEAQISPSSFLHDLCEERFMGTHGAQQPADVLVNGRVAAERRCKYP
jgi:hypothetical protein